ncbi:MAG TPA: AAA family ATPase [Gaiellaceae bacterium]|nr:AAA family ATPase [Gaiellaceae bacterium]
MGNGTPLPGPLRLAPAFAFAGRADELATLKALLPRSPAEGRRAALVAGEAGSGKSRLVRELAHAVAGEGATVLHGGCDVVGGSPYGPFAEALGHLVRTTGPEALHARLGADVAELRRLLPELAPQVGDVERPVAADADTERHRLHTAVTDVLTRAGAEASLLLVLEDLHWADASTLLLVRHLVRSGSDARMLLVATFRDAAVDMSPRLGDTLVDIHRTEGVVRFRLGGLSQPEIGEFVRLATGVEPTAELVGVISDLTGGNAFLVTELWRELTGSDAVEVKPSGARLARPPAELGAPKTVQEVVNQRLSGLTGEANALLELAAVVGTSFELDVVRRAAVLDEPGLLDAVDAAVAAGLLVEEPGRGLAYRFAHELVRRAVADRLSAQRTAALHLQVAEALEADRRGLEDRSVLAGLAHHYAAAAAVGGVERAVELNLLAAESATRAVAFDEAADRLRTALELGVQDRKERASATLRLGEACHRAGAAADALEAFTATAELARQLGDDELLARAAIGFEEACWRPAIHDGRAVELLEEAAAAVGSTDSGLRARVLGGLARALELRGESLRAARARDESVAMSRRLGDRPSLGTTLAAAYWSRGTSTNEEVKEMLLEARELGRELGDVELEAEAASWLVPTHVVLCDHASARETLRELLALAKRTGEPFRLHVVEHYVSALALCDGDLSLADAAAGRSHEWGRLLTGRDASGTYGIQMFGVRRAQGRLAELAPAVRLLDGDVRDVAWRPGLVSLLAELGMVDEATRELHRILGDGLGVLRQSLWLASLVYLAEAAAMLEHVETAEAVYPELVGYAGGNVMVGHLVACYGAADRYLGEAAAVLGEWELAEAHFESALALDMRLGARTWLAHTSFAFARMLLARGRAEDRVRARAQLAAALGLAREIGLPALERRIGELRLDVAEPAGPPDGLSAREVEILVELARGRSNREIGRVLHISEHTAANHVRSILRKTSCANRTEAAGYALRRGLVPD